MATLEVNATGIGPQKWTNNTLNVIRLSKGVIQKSDFGCTVGKSLDPLPHTRDVLADCSNREAVKYSREVRLVSIKLREAFLSTNAEIKSLLSIRYSIEKQLENVRKDMELNKESIEIRTARPDKEKISDGADDLLNAERMHLKNLKQELESNLLLVLRQLKALDDSRKRLHALINERSRVTDLICNSVNFASARSFTFASDLDRFPKPETSPFRTASARDGLPSTSDPLSAFTPECEAALKQGETTRQSSEMLRNQMKDLVDRVQRMQATAHKSVNEGILRKVAETATLKQHLLLAHIDTRAAKNRAQRWFNNTERAYTFTQGPEEYRFLEKRERLNRPIIRVFQRHPGTQLPEAQEMIKTGEGLLDSMVATSKNISMLQSADSRIREDLTNKMKAMDIDLAALRNRRTKSDHKWPLEQKMAGVPVTSR